MPTSKWGGAVLQIGRSLVRFQMVSLEKRPVRKADNLTTILGQPRNLGTLTSWNPLGTSGL